MTDFGGNETPEWKFWVGGVVVLLLIAGTVWSSVVERQHEEKAEADAFNKSGCIIYKDVIGTENIPVKCNYFFTEHEPRKRSE